MKNKVAWFAMMLLLFACSTAPHNPVPDATVTAGSGTIVGTVTLEKNGLPGTTVIATKDSVSRSAVTDVHGRFELAGLPVGRYKVRFEMESLVTRSKWVTVTSGQTVALQQPMNLSSVAEAITVTASAPAQLETTEVQTNVGAIFGVVGGIVGGAPPPPVVPRVLSKGDEPEPAIQGSIAESKFIDTSSQAVTTFSIDVDRASYANIRRLLHEGVAPPAKAVRIEEMINYFNYSYPQPSGNDPFSVTAEVSGCPWNATHRLARIGIQGRNLDQWKMAPNNLVFLLDVSGSMEPPTRLPLIKSAFHILVDRLRPQDSVAIVVYAGAAGVVLPPTSGADKQTILDALDDLQAGGSTNGGEGIELAYKIAQDNFQKSGNNRVILATDGDFNVGTTSLDGLQKLIEEKRKTGIYLTTIGVGDDPWRDDVLELLADKGNGNYSYLDSLKEGEKVFSRELTGTLVTIAKDVKVQVAFDPAQVASYRQIGYEDRALENRDFNDDTKDAGELGAGHSVTALYEIVPAASTSNAPVAEVRLRYTPPEGGPSRLQTVALNDNGVSAYEASPDMQFASAVAELGMLLRSSNYIGTGSYDDVVALVRQTVGPDPDGDRQELLSLVETSRQLSARQR